MKEAKKIVVIGAGGHARETRFLIEELNQAEPKYQFIGYLVSDLAALGEYDSRDEVLGDFSWFKKINEPIAAAIGIGNPKHRLKVVREIRSLTDKVDFPVLIHPNVVYDPNSCWFEEGVIICSHCSLTVNIHVKKYAYINRSCAIGHEAVIGEGCVINPLSSISGGVIIGDGCLIGTGAIILQYIKIGENATVGAGACVTKDVEPGTTVVGIPARPLRSQQE